MRSMGREEQQTIDRLAVEELGLTTAILMEHAAMAIAREVLDMKADHVSFFCGRGNNGGDAYAAARLLLDRVNEVRVYEEENAAESLSGDCAQNRNVLLKLGVTPRPFEAYESREGEIAVDALFGTAFRIERGMPDSYETILKRLAAAGAKGAIRVLAVDLPSGIEAESGRVHPACLKADRTLTFIYPKTAIINYPGRKYAGEIRVDDIGLPASWIERVWQERDFSAPVIVDSTFFREKFGREADSHKGNNGRVTLMAGSTGMGGAAVLAARAAICGGSGLVRLVVPDSLYAAVLEAVPSALVDVLPEKPEARVEWWQEKIRDQDAVGIGPGIGSRTEDDSRRFELIMEAVLTAPRLVLDADALNILAKPELIDWGRAVLRMRHENGLEAAVLTPHPGEAKRLLPEEAQLVTEDRIAAARRLAELWSSVIVLKGAGTVIAFPKEEKLFINTSGNPGLGKGGSGDLLTGLMLSFLGQKLGLETAVTAAVYLHGLAADFASLEKGERALNPEDLLFYLPKAYRSIGWD